MPRPPHPLALTLLGLLLTAGAAASAPIPPPTPLCRVEAQARPLWWASNLRQLTVRLSSDCPEDGIARIQLGAYGGQGSRATGPTEILTYARPAVVWSAQPTYRTVLWLAASGIPYPVPLQEVTGYAAPEVR